MGIGDINRTHETDDASKKSSPSRVLYLIAAVIALGAIKPIFGFFFAEGTIAAKRLSGSGWDDARAELRSKYITGLEEEFPGLSEITKNEYAHCMLDRVIPYLNSTGCDYYYNRTTTSQNEHFAKQTACLQSKDAEKKQNAIDLECTLQTLPNEWVLFKPSFASAYHKKYSEAGLKFSGTSIGDCLANEYVTFLDGTDCNPFNKIASDADQIMHKCIDDVMSSKKFEQARDKYQSECEKTHIIR